jgi:hypothetical protein
MGTKGRKERKSDVIAGAKNPKKESGDEPRVYARTREVRGRARQAEVENEKKRRREGRKKGER